MSNNRCRPACHSPEPRPRRRPGSSCEQNRRRPACCHRTRDLSGRLPATRPTRVAVARARRFGVVMTRDDRRLAADATGQRGAFTSRQARAAGLGSTSLRSRVQSGSLEKIGVRTYRNTQFPSSAMADLHALVVDVGDPVWTTGPTLCALYRMDGYVLRPPFHLITRRDRNVRRGRPRDPHDQCPRTAGPGADRRHPGALSCPMRHRDGPHPRHPLAHHLDRLWHP